MTHQTITYATKEERQLATGAIGVLFRKFALPGVVGLMFVGIQTMIDGVILGNYVGANALAGVNLIMPAYAMMTALAVIIGIGCQTVVSMGLGSGDYRRAHDALTSSFVALFGLSALLSLVFLIFTAPVARLLGANEVLMPYATAYLRSLSPFFPLLTLMFLGDYVMKAIGRPYFAMIALGITVLLNLGFDFLFVVGFGWETAGAGLATGCAFTIGALIVLPVLLNRNSLVCIRKGRFRLRLIGRIFYNGSSEGVSELSAGITMFLFNRAMVYYLGETGVAAFTSISYTLFIGLTIFVGLSDGIIPIISYNYGAGRWDRVRRVLWLALRVNGSVGLILFSVLFLGGERIVTLFFDGNAAEAVRIAAFGSGICAFAFLMNGLNILFSSFFTALGDARTSIIVSLMRGLIFVALGILIYPRLFGIEGIWLTVPVAELLTFIVGVTLLRRKLRRERTAGLNAR